MSRTSSHLALASTATLLLASAPGVAVPAPAHGPAPPGPCTPRARPLSGPCDQVDPDMGNGRARSLATDAHIVYDAVRNRSPGGNHVEGTARAALGLGHFSLALERSSVLGGDGPYLAVRSVKV